MSTSLRLNRFGCILLWLSLLASPIPALEEDTGWINLIGDHELAAWRKPTGAWLAAGDARLDPKAPSRLSAVAGGGVIISGRGGRTRNLLSKEEFGDIEAHFEFLIPRSSNSGVKLQGLYEVQIVDSHAAKKLTGSDCGGIYPRAELLPRYHHLDDGYAPKVNAARPAGEWQTLDLIFKAPRFDRSGKRKPTPGSRRLSSTGNSSRKTWSCGHLPAMPGGCPKSAAVPCSCRPITGRWHSGIFAFDPWNKGRSESA